MKLNFIDLNDPMAGAPYGTTAMGISNNGDVAGYYFTATKMGDEFGFYEHGGVFTTLTGPAGATYSVANGVNSLGQVVGSYGFIGNPTGDHGFLYSGGKYVVISDPNASGANGWTGCYGINDSGQIVGTYGDSSGKEHGFRYSGGVNGTYTTFDIAGATGTELNSINNVGDIAGSYYDAGDAAHGFVYHNGTYTLINDPLGTDTYVNSINDLGEVVGSYFDGHDKHAFLYKNGVYTTIDPSGIGYTEANGINNAGRIVGDYLGGGTSNGFETMPFPHNDFGSDGHSDVFWRNDSGALAEWQMNGATIGASNAVTYQGSVIAPDSSWKIATTGDFNGDGCVDILWRQGSTSALADWTMNGSTVASSAAVTMNGAAVTPDSSWTVGGSGDFNRDGKTDILWRQASTGALVEWTMNGATITSSNTVMSQGQAVTPDASWNIAGISDATGDGKSDVLWRQASTGDLSLWRMNGANVASSSPITSQGSAVTPDSSWSIAAFTDFDGNGSGDVLWRQSGTGTVAVWLMDGSTIASSGNATYQGNAVAPDASWNILQVADFTGDGNADILWQQSGTGALAEWAMRGSQIIGTATPSWQGSAVSPDASWHVQA